MPRPGRYSGRGDRVWMDDGAVETLMQPNEITEKTRDGNGAHSALAGYGWLCRETAKAGGTFRTSTRALARDLGWSDARARRFLLSLAGDPLIDTAFDTGGTEIRLRTQSLGRAKAKKSIRDPIQAATESREADGGLPHEHQKSPRGSRLSADWQPSADDLAYALERGFDESAACAIAEDFRDYWLARADRGAVKLDWRRTWCSRVRELARRRTERRPVPRHARNGGLSAAVGEIFDEMDRRGYDH